MGNKLCSAAADGDLEVVKNLVDKEGVDIDSVELKGTALHYATRNGKLDVVKFLIDRGANVNSRDATDDTPLHCAAYWQHVDIVSYLLENSADVNAAELTGDTPLHDAAEAASEGSQESFQILELLIKAKADCFQPNVAGNTPINQAANEEVLHYMCFCNAGGKGGDAGADSVDVVFSPTARTKSDTSLQELVEAAREELTDIRHSPLTLEAAQLKKVTRQVEQCEQELAELTDPEEKERLGPQVVELQRLLHDARLEATLDAAIVTSESPSMAT
mmetsp:Transcript_15213/g.35844  ORF Transcript_15213/g.35844 Transcript_15213/m.35844 type:complete len:275 (+) Transcript_15213:93-917(+)